MQLPFKTTRQIQLGYSKSLTVILAEFPSAITIFIPQTREGVYMDPLIILILGGFFTGVAGVVFGGSMFFSLPIIQWAFPTMLFGQVVGNLKVGSFFRSIGSTWTTRHQIDFGKSLQISVFALVGTAISALFVSHLSQSWMLPATILAVVLTEYAPHIARLISAKTFHLAALLCGLYAGTLGAGVGLMLVALVRLKHPSDDEIARAKIQARFIEFMLVIVAVLMHWWSQNLVAAVWIPWSAGSLIGGYVGGVMLSQLSKYSAVVQKIILRISYVSTIATATLHV
jgi:uncharacterized membrane protein YfcA